MTIPTARWEPTDSGAVPQEIHDAPTKPYCLTCGRHLHRPPIFQDGIDFALDIVQQQFETKMPKDEAEHMMEWVKLHPALKAPKKPSATLHQGVTVSTAIPANDPTGPAYRALLRSNGKAS
jgi:hypothetical protein